MALAHQGAFGGEMNLNFLCKIGLHKWREHRTVMMYIPRDVQRCQRCGIGKIEMIEGATMMFTKEQMEEPKERTKELLGDEK